MKRNFLPELEPTDGTLWASDEERRIVTKALMAYARRMKYAIYLTQARCYFQLFIFKGRLLLIEIRYKSLGIKDKLFGHTIHTNPNEQLSRRPPQNEETK